jgi:starvation-inducible DNA-binding protein
MAKTSIPYQTRNDLPASTRAQAIAILNGRLASTIDLQLQAKQAHWNVKGPQFIALHELFDKVAEAAESAVDEIAERVVQLGGIAEGTLQAAHAQTALRPYPVTLRAGADHVKALADAIGATGKSARAAIDESDKAGDKDTADLFTEISRELDKMLWFVEAHLQATR